VAELSYGASDAGNMLIQGDNLEALKALLPYYAGRVKCIYIDPPYNTGAKDWKYNNDYVEGDDLYRHSKWLAMMERRLLLAKDLLAPEASVLIIAIDEKEYLRLGLLLHQLFSDASIQMVTTIVNPRAGVARPDAFTRVEEYLFFVIIGDAVIGTASLSGDAVPTKQSAPIWFSLMRTGSNSSRQARPNLFYPVWVTPDGRLSSVGDSLKISTPRADVAPPIEDVLPVWPLRPDGTENTWQLGPAALRLAFKEGTARIGKSGGRTTISYLRSAEKRRIAAGEIEVVGQDEQGALQLKHAEGAVRQTRARTVWASPAHDAGLYGSSLLSAFIPNRSFPFPKSLYAVEDSLRFVVGLNRDAVVVDFFAGSGTTAHAVMRLNRKDAGRRQCISVTNNEVSASEQKRLSGEMLRPGDPEWEQWGIFEYITKPRLEAAVTGRTSAAGAVNGNYKFTDEFPMSDGLEENVEFFTLTYEAPLRVASNREFERLAPLLWLRAGSQGRRIEDISKGWGVADAYGVLADLDCVDQFLDALTSELGAETVFIITEEDRLFESVVRELPEHVEPVRLYEAYLRNFEIESGRAAR